MQRNTMKIPRLHSY